MDPLKELRERRAGVWSKMQALLDESASDGMTHDQAERHAQLEAEYFRLGTDIGARERAAAEQEGLEKPQPVPAGIGTRTGDVIAEDRAYAQAFGRFLRGGTRYLTGSDRDLLEKRAQSEGISAGGGYLVPDGFRAKLVERMKAFGGIDANVEEFSTATGNSIEWPTLDDTGNLGAIVAENTQATTGADLSYGTATLGAYKYDAAGVNGDPFTVSAELLQDAVFDVEAMIVKAAALRIARKQAVHWVNGTGVGEPLGLVYNKTGVMPAANTGITYADLVTYVHSVDPAYRAGAKWAFNDASLAMVRKMVDDNDRPLWLPQQESGMTTLAGGTLLGYPVVIDQAFADFSAASNTVNWGAFGDLSEGYVIRRVKDIQMVVDPYSMAKKAQVQFNFWLRADGTVQNANSYSALTGKA